MTKTIDTLVQDIYGLFDGGLTVEAAIADMFGSKLSRHVQSRITEERREGLLRMSNIGQPDRKLWYTVNTPEIGEPLNSKTKLKFLHGDIIESLLLFLAELAGHEVTRAQEHVEFMGVPGHIDAVIDGVLIDCKSASTYSFQKFASGRLAEDDPFGYIDQLNLYHRALAGTVDPDRFAFLVMDKTLGTICLDVHQPTAPEGFASYDAKVEHKIGVVNSKALPERCYDAVPDGKSGNLKLGTACSYCPFKLACWPNLEVYHYANGPRFLVKVVKEPRVDKGRDEF